MKDSEGGRQFSHERWQDPPDSDKMGYPIASLLLTLKTWLVITQNNGWSLTHFYLKGQIWRLQVVLTFGSL